MAQEIALEMAEIDAANAAGYSISRKKELLAKAGLCLGALAAAVVSSTARPGKADASPVARTAPKVTHPLEYIGVTSNRIWVTNLNQARRAAQNIAATNANTVRIFEPYNMTQTQMDYDIPRLCNAAEAARENGLTLEVSDIGVYRNKEGQVKHDYVPSSAGEVSRYLNFEKSIIMAVAGPNADRPGPNGAPACVGAPLNHVIIEDFNEVDSKSFDSNPDAAQKYAYLESRAIPAYAKISSDINNSLEAAGSGSENNPPFRLDHAVGALAIGYHDALGFLKNFDRSLKADGVQKPGFIVAVHPYPKDPSTDPAQVEAAIYQPIRHELDSAWGKDTVPVFMDEIGVGAISPNNRPQYGPRSLQAAFVSEGTQGQYYRDTIIEAAAEKDVVGVLTFQSQDVKNDGWPDGIYGPNGKRKGDWNIVAETEHEALEGSF